MTVARTVKFPLNDLPNFVFTNIVAAFCPLELDGGGAVSAGLPARRAGRRAPLDRGFRHMHAGSDQMPRVSKLAIHYMPMLVALNDTQNYKVATGLLVAASHRIYRQVESRQLYTRPPSQRPHGVPCMRAQRPVSQLQ